MSHGNDDMTSLLSLQKLRQGLLLVVKVTVLVTLVTYLIVMMIDFVATPLQRQGERIYSIDVPLPGRNGTLDLVTRAPIAALAVVPERYQVEAGLTVFLPLFTSGLPTQTRLNIWDSVRSLYQEMSLDSEWRSLPSVTGYAATDLVGISPQRAHAYIYVPKSAHGKPKKAVIFLHGSLGNLLAYPYLWSRYAEATGSLIVCPTFGFGAWSEEEDVISTVMSSLPSDLQVPRSKTALAGLSAGGYGVVKELRRHSDYRAAVFISAVMPDVSMIKSLSDTWGGKPFLLFHGSSDFVVSESYAREMTAEYRAFGATLDIFPDETHFLFMTQAPRIFERIQDALQSSLVEKAE
jgi:pimeloyl-ACP methyl ester carboxylesterase